MIISELLPGDIVLTRGHSLLSYLLRLGSSHIGESKTEVNHVGIIVSPGPLHHAEIVEAKHTVQRHNIWRAYAYSRNDVAIYRPLNLTNKQINTIVGFASNQVGHHYGYLKLILHFLDWLLQGAYVFRRLASLNNYPICSWLVAYSYSTAGLHFNVEPNAATPDDIWDFVTTNPEAYKLIKRLEPMRNSSWIIRPEHQSLQKK